MDPTTADAEGLLTKLREFARGLGSEERALLGALVAPGVPVACVDDLDTYGLLTGITPAQQRAKILEKFAQNYAPVLGTDEVMQYLGQTGLEAMAGADILKVAPQQYTSPVAYPSTTIATKLKGIAQVHLANLGSRIFYCDHSGFDTHANQLGVHATLWTDVSQAIAAFFADLRAHAMRSAPVRIRWSTRQTSTIRRSPRWSNATPITHRPSITTSTT